MWPIVTGNLRGTTAWQADFGNCMKCGACGAQRWLSPCRAKMASAALALQLHCCIVKTPRRHRIGVGRGWVAQLAEQWTENPRVGGSIPPPAKALFRGEKLGNPAFFSQFPKCPEIKEIPTISSGRQQRRYSRLDQSFAPRAISAHFTYGHPRQAQCSP